MNKSVAIEVDIDRALDFLEEHFTNPEARWGELRALIAKQKAAQQLGAVDDAERGEFEREHLHPEGFERGCELCNPHRN